VTTSRCDENRITHDVIFFLRDGDGRYRRENERHLLRILEPCAAQRALAEVGFAPPVVEPLYPAVPAAYLRDVSMLVAEKPVNGTPHWHPAVDRAEASSLRRCTLDPPGATPEI
jgi:hypothetical protein